MSDKFSDFFEVEETSLDDAKQKFIDNMDMLKSMSVQEQTLYKKWMEITTKYSNKVDASRIVKAKIWTPTNLMNKEQTVREIQELIPRIRSVNGPDDEQDWLMLRVFSHTMAFDQNPGRFLKFLVYDEVTEKYLGAVSLGSDVISITCRDNWIGWSKEDKLDHGRLNNSAIGTCIMATQPFGYNFLGGKLVASMLTTKTVADTWKNLYDNVLIGLTTTSLYGSESMYNSIPFWKKMGSSAGAIAIKPDDDVYDYWHQYIKEHMADEYDSKIRKKDKNSGPVTGIKQQILNIIFRAVGISQSNYKHGFQRGVYYAPLYENSREFFRGEITEDKLIPIKKLDRDVDAVLDWWRAKAISRYEKLHDEGRLKPEILYYNNLIGMTWEEAKQSYLGDVGR